jgi:hypothetical protein
MNFSHSDLFNSEEIHESYFGNDNAQTQFHNFLDEDFPQNDLQVMMRAPQKQTQKNAYFKEEEYIAQYPEMDDIYSDQTQGGYYSMSPLNSYSKQFSILSGSSYEQNVYQPLYAE